MIYGSVCSGIESASVGWHPLGWRAAFFSEIAKAPSAVLAHRWPGIPNLGDMTKYRDWPDAAIDVLVGGTPCQSFSVAGLRKALRDPRGRLVLDYLGVADRYRPRWLVWENVAGVLSTDGGRAFGAILGALEKLGYGWAYRVLDAQYIRTPRFPRAVPQRRRRVLLVGYLGDWRPPAAVLFEPESLSGNPPPRREAGKNPAPSLSARTRGGGGLGTDFEVHGGLIPAVSNSLVARDYKQPRAEDDVGIIPFDTTQMTSPTNRSNPEPGGPCHSFPASGHPPAIATRMAVRRITPREAERLFGFDDDYTLVPYRGGMMKDGPRYEMLGNSKCVNMVDWLGRRIQLVDGLGG